MDMQSAVSYTPYDKSSRRKTGNTIMSAQFEEGDLLSETQNLLSEIGENTERSNQYDEDSTMAPLTSESEMDVMSSVDEYDAEPMSTEILENICDVSQYHPSINRRQAGNKIRDRIKQCQVKCKGALLSTQNMGKGIQKLFKAVVNDAWQAFTFLGEYGLEITYFIPKPRNFAEVTRLSEDIRKPWVK